METIIKIKPEELTHSLVDKIKSYLSNDKDFEITINLKEKSPGLNVVEDTQEEYTRCLDKSILELKDGKTTSFTMKEFEEYVDDNFSS